MTDEQFGLLASKLDIIIKLMGLPLAEGKSQKEAIVSLSTLGLEPREISQILGIARTAVNARLSEIRKKGSKSHRS